MYVHACIYIHAFILLFRVVDKTFVCIMKLLLVISVGGLCRVDIRVVTMRCWGFNNMRIQLIFLFLCPTTQSIIPDGLPVFDLPVEMFQRLM